MYVLQSRLNCAILQGKTLHRKGIKSSRFKSKVSRFYYHFFFHISKLLKEISVTKNIDNMARVRPNLSSYWRHHGTFLNIRTVVRPSDDVCKSDGEACARYVIKNFLQRDNTIKNVYLLELVEV